jgi:sugar lactone lactonase YvrE
MQTTVRKLSLLALTSLLSACGNPDAGNTTGLSGTVLGGQAPIVGSAVQLMAAGTPLSSARLVASATTDTNGNFDLGTVNCASPTDQLYLTATGGNPGGGVNSAISLMTLVGPCESALGSYTINELTTVAAAYSANRFIGPAGCVDCSNGTPADVDNISGSGLGLPNAFSTAPRLVDPGRGTLVALPDATACGASSPPINCTTSRKLGSLANALAACVNSSGPTSSQCVQLFNCSVAGASASSTTACTIPGGATAPSDTLSALLSVARNPVTVAKAGIYYTATRNVVFSPSLGSAPADWTVSRTLVGGGLNAPQGVAVDAQGNVWTDNYYNSLSEFSPAGIALSPGGGFTGGGLDNPFGLAVDASGNIWTANLNGNSLSEFNSFGTAISPAGGYVGGGLTSPQSIAFDTAGNAWIPNIGNSTISEFTSSGSPIGSGFSGGGLSGPQWLAVSTSGNIFVSNQNGNTLSIFSPSGTPISPAGGYAGGGINAPIGVAIDLAGNCWTTSTSGGGVLSKFSASGTALSGTGFTGGGLSYPFLLAIDAAGDVWTADQGSSAISEHSPAGSALSPSAGFSSDGVSAIRGIAVDASGNVWASGNASNTITELIGAAAPTRTPLVSTLSQGFEP